MVTVTVAWSAATISLLMPRVDPGTSSARASGQRRPVEEQLARPLTGSSESIVPSAGLNVPVWPERSALMRACDVSHSSRIP